ncbi:penicillin-binding protein 1C [candidate division KSB1 bacterium]|nr:penicillin-binding protein 1C [candidate division KSB1 bacterium]
MNILKLSLKYKIMIPVILVADIYFYWMFSPVGPVFQDDYSTLVFDTNGRLLRAFLTTDEQYRFPYKNIQLPDKYITALITFEDKRFYKHPGFDPLALMNAFFTNLISGERKRGGSTITMQVCRLANPKPRTYFNKLIECFVALKYSVHFSKQHILRLYAAHVPMGGNIVGIQAASYHYFGKPVEEITWAEAALFAVLPNSPSLLNIGREREKLILKRNLLLKKLYQNGCFDKISLDISCNEPLPEMKKSLPFEAPHFSYFAANHQTAGKRILTTLDYYIQKQVKNAAFAEHRYLKSLGVTNLSVLVVETETGKIRAYIGSQNFNDFDNGGQVDGILAPRSTGSLLKPFLAAKALDRGPYTIRSLIKDVPTYYGTFSPQNATKTFNGLVSLEDMLIKSLNVPAVRLLNEYGVKDFYDFLVQAGFQNLFRSPDGYGLSLILGGAEADLRELTMLYASLGNMGVIRELQFTEQNKSDPGSGNNNRLFSRGSAWLVLNSLRQLARPGSEYYWSYFNNQVPVAWKTGTSYGQKDGWAIGVNKQWTIGVWVGNFTGEGNASIGGAKSAAPLLFTLFNTLTRRNEKMWFDKPVDDLVRVDCCAESGFPAGPNCPQKNKQERPRDSWKPGICPFHRKFIVDKKTGHSVCSLCWKNADITNVNLFIVPPLVKEIMQLSGKKVDEIPPHTENCPNEMAENRLEIVYPVNGIKILVPRDLDGGYEKIVLSARHQHPSSQLFWFIDGKFLGETINIHQYTIDILPGKHKLTIQDDEGYIKSVVFSVFKSES